MGLIFWDFWDFQWDALFLGYTFGIHCDTNRCTDFTDFTDGYGFLEPKCLVLGKKIKKIRTNPSNP
jgi:hypothetical protein